MGKMTRLAAVASMFAVGTSVYGQAPANLTLTPQPMARQIMYRILFREIGAYQNQATQLAAVGKPSAFLANYH